LFLLTMTRSTELLSVTAELRKHGAWNPVDTIPIGRPVKIKSVYGIECLAKVRGRTRWIRRAKNGLPRRIYCVRLDGRTSGDIVAVGWRPA
jgi:hypothetical protein